MPLPLLQPKRKPLPAPVLCVPSSFCLQCPIGEREAICFFKRRDPEASLLGAEDLR